MGPLIPWCDMILTERQEISQSFVNDQRDNGREVCAWTVNEVDELVWMRKSLQIPVLTDKPFLIDQINMKIGITTN